MSENYHYQNRRHLERYVFHSRSRNVVATTFVLPPVASIKYTLNVFRRSKETKNIRVILR